MSNKTEIIKDHRQHFIKRLISRNPLLKCTPSAYREDLTELIKINLEIDKDLKRTSEFDVLKNLLAPLPKKAEIFNSTKKNLAKCNKIKIASDDYFHSTGQLSFYLGYPLVAIPLESNRYYLAPLFLWAISCKVTATSIIFERIKDNGDFLEPQLNRILQVWLAHEKNIHLDWDNVENLNWNTIVTETQQALSAWKKCDSFLNISAIEAIPKNKENKDFFESLYKAKVVSSAIIGYVPIKGQALLDDLDKLEEFFKDSSSNVPVLDYFLNPRQLKLAESAELPIETNKWIVTDSDHSQESVLWNTRKFDLMVLQGPPGTGKSQVIVNLIADALANQQKVLVVCQKKAALEVLKKRLTANGLGELLELVDEPQKDRMRIIKAVREIENEFLSEKSFINIDTDRQEISKNLQSSESFLDEVNLFLGDDKGRQRLNYANLKAKLYELNVRGFNVFEQFQTPYQHCIQNSLLPNNKQQLEELLFQTKEFVENYLACDYPKNPWAINLENTTINNSEVDSLINKLLVLSSFLEQKNNYFYNESFTWLAENPLADVYYESFLSSEFRIVQNRFKELAINTKKLKSWLSAKYVDFILEAVRKGEVARHYQHLKETVGYLELILYIKNCLAKTQIFNLLPKKSNDEILSWGELIECFTFQAWFDDLTSHYTVSKFEFENQKNKLIKAKKEKRDKDIEHILSKYVNRVYYSNLLSNMGLLRLKKSTNGSKTSLRQLYTSGFEQIHQLYPVLLTNPETVSSLLALKPGLYDLVIIDEASQMFMADALPLLYRAKSAVISGDNKQMPPSDFFMALADENIDDVDSEEGEDEETADKNRLIPADGEYCLLEAAEYAIQKGNPNQAMLLVHYRSEFKELIDFSNHAFYDGKLIAATSNKTLPLVIKSPIELNQVENGQAKLSVNDLEALAVVNRIKEIWQQQDSLSLGVITLNVKQKDKIDDLLFEEAQKNSNFANRLEEERNKTKDGEDIGFFVRSVEHVQGDERDIIILSTVYDGVRKNFGAITKKEKGRKRLNVAITRAKLGIIIYSSLNIDAISNENQRDVSENYWFWKYMCYARAISENNRKAAESILISLNPKFQQSKTEAEPDSYFEIDVAEFLRSQNYYVDYQIGESGFRIDLGVKKKADDRLYLCGIECDGRQYHSSWNARLNDIWRQKILENKGWKIIRIWSNDWFDNREATQRNLLNELHTM